MHEVLYGAFTGERRFRWSQRRAILNGRLLLGVLRTINLGVQEGHRTEREVCGLHLPAPRRHISGKCRCMRATRCRPSPLDELNAVTRVPP